MDRLLTIGLTNAIAATILAAAAWAVTRFVRNPAAVRAVWMLVLLKLLTPQVWTVKVPWPTSAAGGTEPAAVAAAPRPPALKDDAFPAPPAAPEPPSVEPLALRPDRPFIPSRRRWIVTWQQAALAAWGVGSLACAVTVLARVRRFARLLHYARPAPPAVADHVTGIADRMGIHCPVSVLFVPGRVCPMLWALGRPRLLVPADLWGRLSEPQRAALLAHELAHYRRRDHLTRALELAVAVLYWWLPTAWVARRQLREAEEQCCDAWVLWALPRSARPYAAALLEAVEFISTRAGVPALASGMGEFHHLKRRLVMIRQGNVSKGLSWGSLAAVCGVAGVLLPLSIGRADDAKPVAKTEAGAPQVYTSGDLVVELSRDAVAQDNINVDVKDSEAKSDSKELRDARQEVERLSRQLDRAKRRLAKAEGKTGSLNVAHSDGEVTPLRVTTKDGDYVAHIDSKDLYVARTDGAADPRQRLSELEQKLNQLGEEIRQLRATLGAGQGELQTK